MENALQQLSPQEEEEESDLPQAEEEPRQRLTFEQEREIERLFERAQQDRAKAYELKHLLDVLDVFEEYEERFLDLFKKPH